MNCFNHPEISSVSQCFSCSRGLCKSCTELFVEPICSVCNKQLLLSERRAIIIEFIAMLIVGYGLLRFMQLQPIGKIMGGLVIIYFYYGMAIVSGFCLFRERSVIASIESSLSGIIGFIFAAMFIGIFIAPFRIPKKIYRLMIIRKALKITR